MVDSSITNGFAPGKYITGSTSGAYGVVEGASNGYLSLGKSLYVKTLYGTFLPGETITSEEGDLLRIAQENTISHFVVAKQGTGYTSGSRISINGTRFELKDINVGINGGTLYKVEILNRDVTQTEYAAPPTIDIEGTSTIVANVVPVLFKNTVLTIQHRTSSLYSRVWIF